MTRTRIKICGLTREEDVRTAVEAGADALGFVFYPESPQLRPDRQGGVTRFSILPVFVSAVGLFVNARTADVAETSRQVRLSLLSNSRRRNARTMSRSWLLRPTCLLSGFFVSDRIQQLMICYNMNGFIAMPVRFSKVCCWIPLRMSMAERERFSIGLSCQKKSGLGSF